MARTKQPRPPAPRRSGATGRPGLDAARLVELLGAETTRQAECAAMLIAVTRMLLNLRGRAFAAWLRSVADDFEESDPDPEDPDALTREFAAHDTAAGRRIETGAGSGLPDLAGDDNEAEDEGQDEDDAAGGEPGPRSRPH